MLEIMTAAEVMLNVKRAISVVVTLETTAAAAVILVVTIFVYVAVMSEAMTATAVMLNDICACSSNL